MTREDWFRVKHIAALALEQPDATREQFVANACRGARDLEPEVRSLLTSILEAASLYEVPSASIARVTRFARKPRV